MEVWQICFNNSKGLRIKAKKKDLLKSDQRFISVKSGDSNEDILINLDNILWFMKVVEVEADISNPNGTNILQ